MNSADVLNALGLAMGFIGATIFWVVGKKEGGGGSFYADAKGEILAKIAALAKKRDRIKNGAMALIAVAFLFQLIALFVQARK